MYLPTLKPFVPPHLWRYRVIGKIVARLNLLIE